MHIWGSDAYVAPGSRGGGHEVVCLAGSPTSRLGFLDDFSTVFSGVHLRTEPQQGLGGNLLRIPVSEHQTFWVL
jgi:hypothetical protein